MWSLKMVIFHSSVNVYQRVLVNHIDLPHHESLNLSKMTEKRQNTTHRVGIKHCHLDALSESLSKIKDSPLGYPNRCLVDDEKLKMDN